MEYRDFCGSPGRDFGYHCLVTHWSKGRKYRRRVPATSVDWTEEDTEILDRLRFKFCPITYTLSLNL